MATPTGATIVRKAADETVNNSDTLQDDNHLLIAVAANEVWYFEALLVHLAASSATPDIKFAFTVPAAATLLWSGIGVSAGSGTHQETTVAASGTAAAFGASGSAALHSVRISGVVVVGANAGDLQLQWAQNTATSENTIVKANSWMIGVKEA